MMPKISEYSVIHKDPRSKYKAYKATAANSLFCTNLIYTRNPDQMGKILTKS
jgi:hypothetical protein